MSIFFKHRRKILLSIVFAILIYALLLFLNDYQQLAAVIRDFDWSLIPVLLALTLFNYGLRFIKWHFYLNLVGTKNLSRLDSLLIFLAGFSMTITPGKAGELLKSFLVKQRAGSPIATTAPIILAERLTDGLAMLLLASTGILLFDSLQVRVLFGLVLIVAVVAIALVQNRGLARLVSKWLGHIRVLDSRLDQVRAFYNSSYELLRVRNLAFATGLGFVSWAGECLALALVLNGLGIPLSLPLVFLSSFAMGFATLFGSVSLLPGGLGAAEAGIDGLLLAFGHSPYIPVGEITRPIAGAATLLIRFATLWFGVTLGFICLLIVQRRFGGATEQIEEESVAVVNT